MLLVGGPGSPADAALLRAFNWPALFPTARMLTRLGDWNLLLPLTLVYLQRVVIPLEETRLRETFGPAYTDYCARVRRWI